MMEEPTVAMNENATRFELDERQRAMLAEMGVRVWMPKTAPAVPQVAKEVAASPQKDISMAPPLLSVPIVDVSNLPAGIASMDWPQLQSAVSACTSCGLSQSRQQAILGDGLASANWMIVGDAPGEEEDQNGRSFAGPAGQLLDNMLKALSLTRDDVYLTHALKCRTPSGRNASQLEVSHCANYLSRQVALVQPKVILAMGRTAALALLQSAEPLGKLRSQVQSFQGVPVVVTYPPAYLLRNQADKAKAWADLCIAASLVSSSST
ncbi:MAG: uracil-DNA glycosylase [Limnohabitans sp.]|jgi:DNA polymerase